MGRKRKEAEKATQEIVAGDKLLKNGVSLATVQDNEIEQKRLEYLQREDMLADETRAELIMNAYAMKVYHSYLPEVSQKYLPVLSEKNFKQDNRIRYFDITKWVIDAEEKNMDKLVNVYQVLSQEKCNIALIYQRFISESQVTLAVSSMEESDSTDTAERFIERIEKSLEGNFPGVQISEIQSGTPIAAGEDKEDGRFYYSVAAISNLASDKSEDFVSQNIEKLLDGIVPTKEEEEYTLVLLAAPFQEQDAARAELSGMYSALAPFMQWQSNAAVSESKIVGAGVSKGTTVGFNVGGSIPFTSLGFGFNVGRNLSKMVNSMEQVGKNTGVTKTYTNYAVKHLLDTIEKQIARIEESTALGMWNFAAYAISADANIAADVAHMYLSLTQGDNSFVSKSAINLWEGGIEGVKDVDKTTAVVLSEISKLRHPEFVFETENPAEMIYPVRTSLTTTLSGRDLARALNFPRKSVSGLPVVESVAFGRDVYRHEKAEEKNFIEIGKIYHMHQEEKKDVSIDMNSLCSHTFIAGSTGKGKSNTIYKLIEKISEKKRDQKRKQKDAFSFMVIEPAKGEYKDAFYEHPDILVNVYGTNPKETELLRMNPFEFPESIHVLEHIDRLTEIFNACWPMYAAMPAILKNAIIRSYERCGWDMINSECRKREYPSFSDVLWQINEILKTSAFSEDNKGDYTGALCTRVESLTTGLNGMIFTAENPCTSEQLFCENVIVDLSRIGSPETKSLIMSMLVMKLQEYRMSENAGVNLPLRHITVLEEAHNILKRTSMEQGAEVSNIQGKAVETLANAIAEMRTYGEGFVIADQAPGLLDASVIRNTNTKIILCLPEEEDRLITGHSMGLRDNQIQEMAKLEKGVAVVYQNDWQEAVLCKFEQYHKGIRNTSGKYLLDRKRFQYFPTGTLKSESMAKMELLEYLLSRIAKVDKVYSREERDTLQRNLNICRLSYDQKQALRRYTDTLPPETIEEAAPLVAMLYDARKILDNRAAMSMEAWNKQILDRLDFSLNQMERWYRNLFIQCLMVELAGTEPGFEEYAQKWIDYTGRKDVR